MSSEVTFKTRLTDGVPNLFLMPSKGLTALFPSLAKVCLSLAIWDQNYLCFAVDVKRAKEFGVGPSCPMHSAAWLNFPQVPL